MGVNLSLVSALDVARDPDEDAQRNVLARIHICAAVLQAAVEGTTVEGVAMVAKHFCAQERQQEASMPAQRIGEELREIHLPAAKACCGHNC